MQILWRALVVYVSANATVKRRGSKCVMYRTTTLYVYYLVALVVHLERAAACRRHASLGGQKSIFCAGNGSSPLKPIDRYSMIRTTDAAAAQLAALGIYCARGNMLVEADRERENVQKGRCLPSPV